MQNSSNDILNNSLNELKKKRGECSQELRNYELAIINLEKVLIEISEGYLAPQAHAGKKPREVSAKKRIRKPVYKISETIVRDAIIEITKNSPENYAGGSHKMKEGYFTSNHITRIIGCSRTNRRVRELLNKFVAKGMLESIVYKRGYQYRYIPIADAKQEKSSQISSRGISGSSVKNTIPVPGTGQTKVRTRDKDVGKLIQIAQKQGYRTEIRGSGHIFVTDDNGKSTTISATGNSSNHLDKVARDLINIGVKV